MRKEERVTLQEAAEALGISEQTARRWIKAGKLKARKPGLRYLIPESAIEELLEGVEGPKVLLPFDVLEVNRRIMAQVGEVTGKELRGALDAEYESRFEDFSLEELLEMEDRLMEQYRDLKMESNTPEIGQADPSLLRATARVSEELRAVMVARVGRGLPWRTEAQKRARERSRDEVQT